MKRSGLLFIWITLGMVTAGAIFAPFLAPYQPEDQARDFFYAPPTAVHFFDEQGSFSVRPFIYDYARISDRPLYRATQEKLFLEFWVEGAEYRWLGATWDRHLFGVSASTKPVFLLGSDSLGRDQLSRLLYGMRFSLGVGLAGILFTLLVGVGLGSLAGYAGGIVDTLVMRTCDLFLSLPGLFLVLGLRAVVPLEISTATTFWLIVLIFTLIGWGSVTRVIRGQVLTLKERQHVLAAKVIGASDWRVLIHHILPLTSNYLVVQASVLLPLFILGEITLSFLGVGVQEPGVSMGTLLNTATSLQALAQFRWLTAPVVVIFLTVLSFNLLGERLKALDRVRARWW